MTFDELHTELMAHSWRCRRFPRCSREALRAVLNRWDVVMFKGVTSLATGVLRDRAERRVRLVALERRFGSFWILLTIELLKVVIPWFIEWWKNRADATVLLEALIAEERTMQ